ncbi:uncharacterized protein LOC135287363 isoform X5 [Passer domesticus]|uniref:uncharacterized protein LOC135287363 isoform X5 n=1 Tax=Passer domesticus TaxID=48849 RepID=UPI0030FEF751
MREVAAAEGGCLCRLVPPRRGRMSLGAERAAAAGAWCPVESGLFWPAQMYDPAFLRVPMAAGVQLSLGRSGLPRYMIQHFWKSPWLQVGVVYVRCAVEPGTFWPAQMYDPAFWRAPVAGVPSGVQLSLGRSGLPRYMIQHFWKSPWLQVGVVYVRCAVEPGTFWPAQMYDPAFWRAPVAGVPSGVQLSLGRSGLPRYMIQHFWKSPWLQVGVVYVRCAVEPGTFWPAQMYDPAFWRAPVAGVPSGVQLSLGRSGLPRCMIQHFGESPWLGFPEGFVRCAVEPGMFWPTRMYDPAFWRAPVAGGPAEVCQVRFGVTQVLVRSWVSLGFGCIVGSASLGKVLLCVCSGTRSSLWLSWAPVSSRSIDLWGGEGKVSGRLLVGVLLCLCKFQVEYLLLCIQRECGPSFPVL